MALTCREFIEFLGDYHSSSLDPRERSRFEAHLFECVECVEYLKSYAATIRLRPDRWAPTETPILMKDGTGTGLTPDSRIEFDPSTRETLERPGHYLR